MDMFELHSEDDLADNGGGLFALIAASNSISSGAQQIAKILQDTGMLAHGDTNDKDNDENFQSNHAEAMVASLQSLESFDQPSKELVENYLEVLSLSREISELERDVIDRFLEKLPFISEVLGELGLTEYISPGEEMMIDGDGTEEKEKRTLVDHTVDGATKIGGKKGNFGPEITDKLFRWIVMNPDKSKPTAEDYAELCQATSLQSSQVKSWVCNARRRRVADIEKYRKRLEKESRVGCQMIPNLIDDGIFKHTPRKRIGDDTDKESSPESIALRRPRRKSTMLKKKLRDESSYADEDEDIYNVSEFDELNEEKKESPKRKRTEEEIDEKEVIMEDKEEWKKERKDEKENEEVESSQIGDTAAVSLRGKKKRRLFLDHGEYEELEKQKNEKEEKEGKVEKEEKEKKIDTQTLASLNNE